MLFSQERQAPLVSLHRQTQQKGRLFHLHVIVRPFLRDLDAHRSLIRSIIRPILGFGAAQFRLAGCDRLYTPKSARAEPQQRNTGFATGNCTVGVYDNNPGGILFPAGE